MDDQDAELVESLKLLEQIHARREAQERRKEQAQLEALRKLGSRR
jgi:hypothetical protein